MEMENVAIPRARILADRKLGKKIKKKKAYFVHFIQLDTWDFI